MSETVASDGIASPFKMGREVDGNREIRVFTAGQSYDLDAEDIVSYTADEATFPYPAS